MPAIVGTAISTQAKQAFPIAQENGVVAFSSVSTAAGLSSIGDYIFRAGLATDKMNPAGVKVTHANLGYERVALIYNHADVFSTARNADVNAALMELGVEVATDADLPNRRHRFVGATDGDYGVEPRCAFCLGVGAASGDDYDSGT